MLGTVNDNAFKRFTTQQKYNVLREFKNTLFEFVLDYHIEFLVFILLE